MTRTVVTYLAAAFAFLEGVWLYGPALGFVDDVSRVIAGIVVLGFPLAVVLAWTYDLTPEGIVRTPDDDIDDASDSSAPVLRGSAWLLLCGVLVAVGFVFRSMRM